MAIRSTFFAGLDLGMMSDHSALTVTERIETETLPPDHDPQGSRAWTLKRDGSVEEKASRPHRTRRYQVRHVKRWPVGVPYPTVVGEVVKLFEHSPMRGQTLVVDATGVGVAVLSMFAQPGVDAVQEGTKWFTQIGTQKLAGPYETMDEARFNHHAIKLNATLRPVTITSGKAAKVVGAGYHVAKKELAGVLQMLLSSRLLTLAKGLPEAKLLVKELENFQSKIHKETGHEALEAARSSDHDDIVMSLAIALYVAENGSKRFWMR